ncbi:MAG: LptF/LptG family permease [candidate division Zixibacteria bacterium]|nr:LptF/LptG family permease [candidate division Zixibacteria bacterium]
MRILDRYLIRQFSLTLIFSLVAFWLVFLVVDLVEHVDKFIDKQAPLFLVIKYYAFYTPYILVLALPVAVLLACLFSLGQLARHNELTAMKSAGVSLYRILLPLFVLSFLISLFTVAFGETILPHTSQKKEEIKAVEIEKGRRERNIILHNVFAQAEDGRIFHLASYDTRKKAGTDALVQRFQESRLKEEIRAKKASWGNDGWLFEHGVERVFSDSSMKSADSEDQSKTDLDSLAPATAERYQAFDRLFRLDLKIKPEALVRRQKQPEEMGYMELAEYVKIRKRAGAETLKEVTDLNSKIAYPFINFLIVLFGAPIAANPRRSGMAVGVAITLFIAFCSYIVIKGSLILGHEGILPPLLAAWSANILFAVLGTILLMKAKK